MLSRVFLAGFLTVWVVSGGATVLEGQGPPDTDVFLVTLDGEGDEKPVFGKPMNITDRGGYDNQPTFLGDGRAILYTSIREGQADIYKFDLASSKSSRVTATKTSEYSPTLIDGGKAISVIRDSEDGTQILWSFPLGVGEPKVLLPDVNPVGYHAWGSEGGLLLFILGEPHTLQWWTSDGGAKVVASDIGRSLLRLPETNIFSFVHKAGGEGWWLKTFDPATGAIEKLIATRPEREDLAWDPQGRAWMADGGRLYRYCPACGGGWRRMVDFGKDGIHEITRLAFSPDGNQLAFVAEVSGESPQD